MSEAQRTVMGIGVPVAPSFLDLEDEETVAYGSVEAPSASLPALLKQCAKQSAGALSSAAPVTPSEIRPRGASFHTVPNFPRDSSPEITLSESNLHEVDGDQITDALVTAPPPQENDGWIRLRIGASSYPPSAIGTVPSARPRPSRRRSFFAKLLFATIAVTIGLVITSELAAAGKIPPGLDPRPVLTKGAKLAQDQLEHVRKLAGH